MTKHDTDALLVVVFADGQRPTLADVGSWQADPARSGFAVTHGAANGDRVWAELLTSGLAFDCVGLGGGAAADRPEPGQRLGLDRLPAGEAVALMPAPHIASGANLPPVVRALVGLGAEFARMPAAEAICWLPSGCWMAPDYFIRIVNDWLSGGAFPALGLTMFNRLPDGSLETQGLGFFVGQEIIIQSAGAVSADRLAHLGIRMVNELIVRGPLAEPQQFAFDGFPSIQALPGSDGLTVKVAVNANAG